MNTKLSTSKTVHATYNGEADLPQCGAQGGLKMGLTDAAVTCKRCIKMLDAEAERVAIRNANRAAVVEVAKTTTGWADGITAEVAEADDEVNICDCDVVLYADGTHAYGCPAPMLAVTACLSCGEGLDDENITDFCSDRCQSAQACRCRTDKDADPTWEEVQAELAVTRYTSADRARRVVEAMTPFDHNAALRQEMIRNTQHRL